MQFDSVVSIIKRDSYDIEDQRGLNKTQKIDNDDEAEIKNRVIKNLKKDLDARIPLCSKDVQVWLKEVGNLSL